MANWFIKSNNDEADIGPLRPSELLQRVRSGSVLRETDIRKDDSAWFKAGTVGGLFEAAMRPTIEYFCPQCRKEVPEPPVTCPHCDLRVTKAITKITENSISHPAQDSVPGQAAKSMQSWLKKKRIKRDGPDA